ncbi:ATP synthase-coupling factor 6, mitochondrial [Drosophila guanche]|uniref:Blast:ATP synthase-coupling factor 6, mitochondrial n=1 Tax=Drosophila guanche TaxID=7266 RepID=A0A3B0JAQ3_DROGU|nr:ATP synthase-coupling factor 6, mitochondrial [Drosophila guanche]SPP77543.1 blast:ATP synthase-coupling factor 6%2C mitochondrial [Drosophila guanche]
MFRLCCTNFSLISRRNIGLSAARRYKDPIYEIFLDKVREYRLKSPTGKALDAGPEFEQELNETLERLALKFGGGDGVDMLEFPKFKEPEVTLDPLSIFAKPKEETEKSEESKEVKNGGKEQENTAKDQQKTKETKGKDQQKAKDTKAEAKDIKAKDTNPKDDKKK